MYGLLYLAAPAIGDFYNNELLIPIVRVLAVVLFPGAVISVQTAYVSRKMEFQGLFKATMGAVVVSGAASVWMAYAGMGVWAMVGQQIAYYLALMTGLFFTVTWRPRLVFVMSRVRSMLAFGWKLLLAALLDTLFSNLYGLIMGKIYNEELLGAYNRGDQFPKLIVNNLGTAIQSVLLPAFAARQDDLNQVRSMVRRAIRTSSFLVLPMLFGLFAVADTMVLALLGEKWMICVPYLRIMCVAYSFWPIHITNLQAINAVGRSDVFLKLEVIKKTVGHPGPNHRNPLQSHCSGVHQGGNRFPVYLYQRLAQQKAFGLQHRQPVDGYYALHGAVPGHVRGGLRPSVCDSRGTVGEAGFADSGGGCDLRWPGLDSEDGKLSVSAGNCEKEKKS